jgi:hypothetical protein
VASLGSELPEGRVLNLPLFSGEGGADEIGEVAGAPGTVVEWVACVGFATDLGFAADTEAGFALICNCKLCTTGSGVRFGAGGVVCVFPANDSPQPLSKVMRVRNKSI